MTSPVRVSVIMPCFNHGHFLSEAVASVLDAKRDDVELVVVDDGSTDERTREQVNLLCSQGIRIIRQENKGVGIARNNAILASHGDYIFPLDADDHLRSGWMDRGVQIMDSDLSVGVVYGDAEFFGTLTGLWRPGGIDLERLLHWNYIPVSALYRRSVWEQNVGYDGTMPVQGFEDWDFWLGALEHGWRFEYVPEVFFEYRKAEESMLTRAGGFETKTKEFVAKKHGRLYQEAWLSVIAERQSILTQHESLKWNLRNLRRLLKLRIARNLSRTRSDSSQHHHSERQFHNSA